MTQIFCGCDKIGIKLIDRVLGTFPSFLVMLKKGHERRPVREEVSVWDVERDSDAYALQMALDTLQAERLRGSREHLYVEGGCQMWHVVVSRCSLSIELHRIFTPRRSYCNALKIESELLFASK